MTGPLIGPPCVHCGLVTFANPCKLIAYDLEETAILGYAVECFMCKSKGPWAPTPEQAIQRYSPWVSFKQRLPLEQQNVLVWDEEADMAGSLRFSNILSHAGRYDAAAFTHWAPVFPRPSTYHRVTDQLPQVQPPPEPPPSPIMGDHFVGFTCEKQPDCILGKDHEGECDLLPF